MERKKKELEELQIQKELAAKEKFVKIGLEDNYL